MKILVWCCREAHHTRTFPGKPGVMGRVIRTFITAGGYRDLDVSAETAHGGEGEATGARMPPRPHSPGTAAHTAKQGRICWGFHDREKMASSLSMAYQNPEGSESIAGQRPVSFSAFGPRAVQSGCGHQPAKSVWLPVASQTLCLPHPRVGKTCSPRPCKYRRFRVLRTAGRCKIWGVILLFLSSSPCALIRAGSGPNLR